MIFPQQRSYTDADSARRAAAAINSTGGLAWTEQNTTLCFFDADTVARAAQDGAAPADPEQTVRILQDTLAVDVNTARELTSSDDDVIKRQVNAIVRSHLTLPRWQRELDRARERLRILS
jgi:rRNA processing protein Krr1/Pno1